MAKRSWDLEKVAEDIVRMDAGMTLAELYSQIGAYRLPVEPLSREQPLGEFLLEGGFGYNALREGPLASKLYRVKASGSEGSFEYGLEHSTLYNAGYPLHRILCAGADGLTGVRFEKIEEITVPVVPEEKSFVVWENMEGGDLRVPPEATNALFINEFGAGLMGLEGRGMLTTYPLVPEREGVSRDDAWEQRFLQDQLPEAHRTSKFLTMKSGSVQAFEIFAESCEGLFLALFCNIGVLLVLSGERVSLEEVARRISRIHLTFPI